MQTISRYVRFVFALALIAISSCPCLSQKARQVVDESRAVAILEGQAIRFRVPLLQAAKPGTEVVAHLLSPNGEALSEARQPVADGASVAEILLDFPKDKKGAPANSIEWYRVVYRVEVPARPAENSILSLGAVAQNLFRLSVARPEKHLEPGKQLVVRVFAGNPVTRRPFRGVEILGSLETGDAGLGRQKMVCSATTDRAGEAILTFTIPDSKVVLASAANLTLLGTSRGSHGELATSRLETEIAAPSNGYIRILEDKQLYQPGQTVHIRALAFGGLDKPVPNAPLTLTVKDPGEKKILEKTLTTDRFGIAAYDWKLDSTIDTGNYNLSIEYANKKDANSSNGTDLGQSIKIERYDLPEFTVSAELDRGYYLDGQTPEVKIHARFLFGKAVAGGQVRLVREEEQTWNPKTRQMEEHEDSGQRGILNENGVATFHLDLSDEFEKFRDASYFRYRDLTFHVYVTDSATGKTEPRKFSLRVSREPIHIYLEEIGGDERQGEFLVNTVYADGTSAACQVTIDAIRKETAPARMAAVNTSRYGLAKVRLAYPAGAHTAERLKLRIQARDAKGLKGQFATNCIPIQRQRPSGSSRENISSSRTRRSTL